MSTPHPNGLARGGLYQEFHPSIHPPATSLLTGQHGIPGCLRATIKQFVKATDQGLEKYLIDLSVKETKVAI